jgi:integrase
MATGFPSPGTGHDARLSLPSAARPPRLLDRLRAACRLRHYSIRTEDAYAGWVTRFILFHGKRHPLDMGAAEVNAFLTDLAVNGRVSASTQNQAFGAILFLYRCVLEVDTGRVAGVVRAKRPKRLPVVLTRDEVRAVLAHLDGVPRLVSLLLYGSGLRLLDALRQRVKDVDFARMELLVRHGKGGKDRMMVLPASAKPGLLQRLDRLRPYYERDARAGWGLSLPEGLCNGNAARAPVATETGGLQRKGLLQGTGHDSRGVGNQATNKLPVSVRKVRM